MEQWTSATGDQYAKNGDQYAKNGDQYAVPNKLRRHLEDPGHGE